MLVNVYPGIPSYSPGSTFGMYSSWSVDPFCIQFFYKIKRLSALSFLSDDFLSSDAWVRILVFE